MFLSISTSQNALLHEPLETELGVKQTRGYHDKKYYCSRGDALPINSETAWIANEHWQHRIRRQESRIEDSDLCTKFPMSHIAWIRWCIRWYKWVGSCGFRAPFPSSSSSSPPSISCRSRFDLLEISWNLFCTAIYIQTWDDKGMHVGKVVRHCRSRRCSEIHQWTIQSNTVDGRKQIRQNLPYIGYCTVVQYRTVWCVLRIDELRQQQSGQKIRLEVVGGRRNRTPRNHDRCRGVTWIGQRIN